MLSLFNWQASVAPLGAASLEERFPQPSAEKRRRLAVNGTHHIQLAPLGLFYRTKLAVSHTLRGPDPWLELRARSAADHRGA